MAACFQTIPDKLFLLFICKVVSDSFAAPRTVARQAPLTMGFSRQEYWSGSPFPPPGDLPSPGIELVSPAWQVDSLPLASSGIELRSPTLRADALASESPGKPKNTGVGSLARLQAIFLTQKSNWDLLHCRQILYQLSYHAGLQYKIKSLKKKKK